MEANNSCNVKRTVDSIQDLRFKLNQANTGTSKQQDLRYVLNIKNKSNINDLRTIINKNVYKSDLRKTLNIKKPDLRNSILNKNV